MPVRVQTYRVRSAVDAGRMCEVAPEEVYEMMRMLVRETSPDWSTIRLTIDSDRFTNSWDITLEGQAIPRG